MRAVLTKARPLQSVQRAWLYQQFSLDEAVVCHLPRNAWLYSRHVHKGTDIEKPPSIAEKFFQAYKVVLVPGETC